MAPDSEEYRVQINADFTSKSKVCIARENFKIVHTRLLFYALETSEQDDRFIE